MISGNAQTKEVTCEESHETSVKFFRMVVKAIMMRQGLAGGEPFSRAF